MIDLSSIDFDSGNISETIDKLKNKSVSVPSWDKLIKNYEPTMHEILSDTTPVKDKIRGAGQ